MHSSRRLWTIPSFARVRRCFAMRLRSEGPSHRFSQDCLISLVQFFCHVRKSRIFVELIDLKVATILCSEDQVLNHAINVVLFPFYFLEDVLLIFFAEAFRIAYVDRLVL